MTFDANAELGDWTCASDQTIGRVLAVQGSQAQIGLLAQPLLGISDIRTTVGKYLSVRTGRSTLLGLVTDISLDMPAAAREEGYRATARLDLMGEIKEGLFGAPQFQRGISEYPIIGDPALPIGHNELKAVYGDAGLQSIDVGHLQQDETIRAYINVDAMVTRHFAVLGTTGVGKSSGVALVLQRVLATRPNLRIFLLDGHNEYGQCFGDYAQVLNPRNLKLPFWLFNFEEFVDVIFGGRPGVEEEVEILAEVLPLAKANYSQYRAADRSSVLKRDARSAGYTADTPVPYRLADLIGLIDERMGRLENRSSRMKYHKLLSRIDMVSNDPRYTFMFENANVGGDTMAEVLSQLLRLPPNGKPMTVMQLGGFPIEVVDSVVSVLCRMAFDFGLWSDGAFPLLFVCEEAHRYASADRTIGFGPTRRAISRIAKEGRKYGVYLGLVSQRPAELDPTIISQCSTLFAMRMSNDRDQAIIRSAVSDAAANLLAFLPSLATREVLAFGEGVPLPARLKFEELPDHLRPSSEAKGMAEAGDVCADESFINAVIGRWRGAMLSQRPKNDDPFGAFAPLREDGPPMQPAFVAEPEPPAPPPQQPQRVSILKKRLDAGPEPDVGFARSSGLLRKW